MKDRRKPWQKAMINKEFRFSLCGSMLQSTARAHKSADKRFSVFGECELDAYARALGLSREAARERIAAQRKRNVAGFRVHSHAIAAE